MTFKLPASQGLSVANTLKYWPFDTKGKKKKEKEKIPQNKTNKQKNPNPSNNLSFIPWSHKRITDYLKIIL